MQSRGSSVDNNSVSQISESGANRRLTALRIDLEKFLDYVESEVVSVAQQIESDTSDPNIRKATLLWRVSTTRFGNELARTDLAPAAMLLEVLKFCERQVRYLNSGAGKTIFQGHQSQAVAVTQRLMGRIETIARKHVPENSLPKMFHYVQSYARKHPVEPVFVYGIPDASIEHSAELSLLTNLVTKPLSTIGKVGKDILDPTSRLADRVHEFNELIEDFPTLLRWQLNLLWLQLQDSDSMQRTVRSVEDVSRSSIRLAAVAESLPKQVREELQAALNDVITQQEELRTTIKSFNRTLEKAGPVSASVERSLGEITRAGKVWEVTANSITELIKQIQQFKPARTSIDPGAPPNKGFNINEYTDAAEALAATTVELQKLFAEVRGFVEGDTLQQDLSRVDTLAAAAIGPTISEARTLIDHLAWRLVQLCGLVFLLAIIYSFFARRCRAVPAPSKTK